MRHPSKRQPVTYNSRTSVLTFSPAHVTVAADNDAYINRGESLDATLASLREHLRLCMRIDIDDMLAQNGQIAVIWDVNDVMEMRSDLTREQAWEVLETAQRYHDGHLGITWTGLHSTAFDLFSNAPTDDDGGQP